MKYAVTSSKCHRKFLAMRPKCISAPPPLQDLNAGPALQEGGGVGILQEYHRARWKGRVSCPFAFALFQNSHRPTPSIPGSLGYQGVFKTEMMVQHLLSIILVITKHHLPIERSTSNDGEW